MINEKLAKNNVNITKLYCGSAHILLLDDRGYF